MMIFFTQQEVNKKIEQIRQYFRLDNEGSNGDREREYEDEGFEDENPEGLENETIEFYASNGNMDINLDKHKVSKVKIWALINMNRR